MNILCNNGRAEYSNIWRKLINEYRGISFQADNLIY